MRRDILDLLKRKAKNEGLTILFTTHNLEEADYLCDRIAIMDRGRLLALDTTDNLKRLYGETKAIEILLSPVVDGRGVARRAPSYDEFFSRLTKLHPDVEISKLPEGTDPAVIISEHPEQVIESVISLTSELKEKLEWLNIRKSALEDVFIQTVSGEVNTEDNSGKNKKSSGEENKPS